MRKAIVTIIVLGLIVLGYVAWPFYDLSRFINAADRGSGILAILVGAVIVTATMTITFIERTREFGVLAAIVLIVPPADKE